MMRLVSVKDSGVIAFRSESPEERALNKLSLNIATGNVQTLLKSGKLENSKKEMRRNRQDVLSISEMRWLGKGELQSDKFLVIYSDDSAVGKNDMGFILNSNVPTSQHSEK